MRNAPGSPRDAASVLFNLPGHRVLDAVDLPDGRRRVVIEAEETEAACPDCGVLSDRVHQRTRRRLRDVKHLLAQNCQGSPGSRQTLVALEIDGRQ